MSTPTRKQLESRVDTLGSIIDKLISELTNLKDLSIGMMSVVKKLPGYEEAINQLKKEIKKKMAENKTNGELLQELITLIAPMSELAKYNIEQINADIKRNEIINEYVKKAAEEAEEKEEEANLEVVEAEEL